MQYSNEILIIIKSIIYKNVLIRNEKRGINIKIILLF